MWFPHLTGCNIVVLWLEQSCKGDAGACQNEWALRACLTESHNLLTSWRVNKATRPIVGERQLNVTLCWIESNDLCDTAVQTVMGIFREECGARMHWGKAGWPRWAACFDGAKEYPETWCSFGCAVRVWLPPAPLSLPTQGTLNQWEGKLAGFAHTPIN